MSVEVKFKFPDLAKAVKKNHPRILNAVAASMQTNRAMLFDAEGNYNGHQKWKPLAFRKGMILSKTGALRKSMGPRNDGVTPGHADGSIVRFNNGIVKTGTDLAYAAIQNKGGIIRASKAEALKIPIPSGKGATDDAKALRKKEGGFIFRKKVTIPARDFSSITAQDKAEFEETMVNAVAQILKEAK